MVTLSLFCIRDCRDRVFLFLATAGIIPYVLVLFSSLFTKPISTSLRYLPPVLTFTKRGPLSALRPCRLFIVLQNARIAGASPPRLESLSAAMSRTRGCRLHLTIPDVTPCLFLIHGPVLSLPVLAYTRLRYPALSDTR